MKTQLYYVSCDCDDSLSFNKFNFQLRVSKDGIIREVICSTCNFTKSVKQGKFLYPRRKKK